MPVGGRLAGKAGYSAGYQGQGNLWVSITAHTSGMSS